MSAIVVPDRVQSDAPISVFGAVTNKVLAASGFIMLGFVALHMAGNLLAFGGSTTFNAYARAIRELGSPWLVEGALLVCTRVMLVGALVLHLMAHAYRLWRSNDSPLALANSPVPPWYATLPASVLQVSGGVIAMFLVLHIAQLTIGATHSAFVADDPYHNLVVALRSWPVAVAYVAAAVAVGVHLLPGVWTGMRSLGLIGRRTERFAGALSPLIALTLAVGLATVPVAVLVGVIG